MKVMYLTWGETPRSYGVFGSQVIRQFSETKQAFFKDDDFYFVSAVPIINSGLVREKHKYFSELKKVKSSLKDISFRIIPIYFPQNFVNPTSVTFSLMHVISHRHLLSQVNNIKPDVIHCRSYHAAWAALVIREKYSLNYKVIFDARGLWPDEVALKKNFSVNDKHYKFLKGVERYILDGSDAVVSVSETMQDYFLDYGVKKSVFIPLSAPVSEFKFIKERALVDDSFTLGYIGALSDSTWHKPLELLNLYREVKKHFKNVRLLIVTTSPHSAIKEIFSEFSESEVVFTKARNTQELSKCLSKMDIGTMSYFRPTDDRELTLSNTVIAVKTAEYLSSGIPMICNKYCGGASAILEKYSIGITYDPVTMEGINKESICRLLNSDISKKAVEVADNLFDYRSNARRYSDLYRSLI